MRVLVVAQQLRRPAPGGIGTYVRGLLAGVGNGAEVSLLAGRAPAGKAPDPLSALGRPVLASALPGRLLTRAWGRGLCAAPVGFDVVHGASFAVPPSPSAPLAVAVHDLAWRVVPDAFPPRGRRWHEAALGRALANGAVLVVPSKATADALVEAGADGRRIAPLSPMYGCDHLPPPDAGGAAALLSGLGVEGPYLLAVGTREPRKNLGRLIEAYQRARADLPAPWPLVVAGPGGWGGELASEGAPRPPGVVVAGEVPPGVLAALYRGARCVAYVPLFEGFGLPAVEAMAFDTPVVASPMPSTGGAALEVSPTDVGAMARALVVAATDEGRRAELVEAGRQRSSDMTWAAAAAAHLELWSTL